MYMFPAGCFDNHATGSLCMHPHSSGAQMSQNEVWDSTLPLVPLCGSTDGGKLLTDFGSASPSSASTWADASAKPFVPSTPTLVASKLNASAEPFTMPQSKQAIGENDGNTNCSAGLESTFGPHRMIGAKLRKGVTARSTISALNLENAGRSDHCNSGMRIKMKLDADILGHKEKQQKHKQGRASQLEAGEFVALEIVRGNAQGLLNGTAWGGDTQQVKGAGYDAATLNAEENLDQTTCTPSTSENEEENDVDSSPHEVGDDSEEGRGFADAEGVIGVHALLAWRHVSAGPPPHEIGQLFARPWFSPHGLESKGEVGETTPGCEDRALFGSRASNGRDRAYRGDRFGDSVSREKVPPVLTPSASAFKRLGPADRVDRPRELKRCVQSLLNKICPENVVTIAKRIKSEADVCSLGELESVIVLIFHKALAEPHYCETYADLVHCLKSEMPEFLSSEGGKPVTFKSLLLTVCQIEFESMPRTFSSVSESLDVQEHAVHPPAGKKRFLANMKFIGHLFLRQLISTKVISSIVKDLMLFDSTEAPEEPIIECVCELLCSIGLTLEANHVGQIAVTQVCGRMLELKSSLSKVGMCLYSKRVQFVIQDLLDTRSAGWARKSFKASAKTKKQVRKEHDRERKDASAGKAISGADYIVAGQRPIYLLDQ